MAHEVKANNLNHLMPCNLSVADRMQWRRNYVRFLFRERLVNRRCPTCGHQAVQ
jgi:hypothetical protein